MADATVTVSTEGTQASEAPATTETKATATPPAVANTTETPAEPMIPKSRLDEVLAKLKTFEGEKTKAEKEREAAETARLAEQGEYKKIADQLQAKLEAAEKAARDNELRLLRRDAASQTNLPAALADRLQGETLDEMLADAKSILAALPKPAAPNINPNPGPGGAPVPGQKSDEERRQFADKYGVNPNYVQ